MSDLNIRAAKALGCGVAAETHRIIIRNVKPIQDLIGGRLVSLNRDQLKFTTSYDWAMLGIKVLCEESEREEFEAYLDNWNCHLGDYLFATPAQITEAWVNVLEGANK